MANRKRAEARRKAQAKAARRGRTLDGVNGADGDGAGAGVTINIWVIIVVVLALVTGGVIWAASSGDDKAADTTDTQVDGTSDIPVSQKVTVEGNSLPFFDPDNTGQIAPVGDVPDEAAGMTAPLLSGFDFQGDPIAIDPAANGPYMVVFLAHWCPHCNAEVPRLLDWKASGGVPAGLNVLGIATAVSASAPNYPPGQWFTNKGWSWPVMVDESLGEGVAGLAASTYGASGWPYFVIIGADGLVKARVSGEVAIADLQTIVNDALAS